MAKRIDGEAPLEEDLDEFPEDDELLDGEDDEEEDPEEEEEEEDGEDGEESEDEEEEDDDDDEDEDELLRAAEEEVDESEVEPIFEEEAGYRDDFSWDSLPEGERERHEEILRASSEELTELNYKRLGVLDRWAAAQAFARLGMREEFQESCRSILKSRRRHEGLAYEDIYLELISDLAEIKEFDEAFGMLDKFLKSFPEEEEIYQRVQGLLLIESGKIHEGKSLLDELMSKADDHGELHLELGDDLLAMGHPELALRVLTRGKDFARRNRDTELMTALDETMRQATTRLEGED